MQNLIKSPTVGRYKTSRRLKALHRSVYLLCCVQYCYNLLTSDRDLHCLLPGQHPGERLVGDGALHDPALCCPSGQRETLRSGADCDCDVSQESLLFRHAGSSACLHMECGKSCHQFCRPGPQSSLINIYMEYGNLL